VSKPFFVALALLASFAVSASGIVDLGNHSDPRRSPTAVSIGRAPQQPAAAISNPAAAIPASAAVSAQPAPTRAVPQSQPQPANGPHDAPADNIPTASVRFTYTPGGMRDSITDGNGVTLFNYNAQNRLVGVEFPYGEAVAYSYDKAGNLTELVTAHQRIVYTYDARNRLETVTDATGTTRFSYDQVGNRTGLLRPNGVRTTYAYGPRNWLENIAHYTASNALLFSAIYTHDASGLRRSAVERDALGIARTITYTYDALKRVTEEAIVGRDPMHSRRVAWTYDKVGNRLTETLTIDGLSATIEYTYDRNDRLLTERMGGQLVTYTYDANGNTQSKTGPNGRVEYDYDRAQRLVEMRDGMQRIRYGYDSDGVRLIQTVFPANGEPVSTYYLLDKNQTYTQVIEEHQRIGSGPRRLSAIYTFGDGPIAQTRGQQQSFILADGMGSTRLVTDSTGSVTDTIAFDAFGNELTRTGTTELAHLYRGEQFDPNLGQYYLRARYMDPSLGRFTQMDPFGGRSSDPLSLHKYQYAHLNPVMNTDPSGRETLVGLNTGISVNATLGMTARGIAQVTVNRVAGRAFEKYVGSLLQRFVAQHGGRVFSQVRFTGPGGVRVADYVVQIGNRFVVVEAKTKIPLAGQALIRLGNQIKTFAQGASSTVPGTATEVIVITEETAVALEASFLAVESKVATGTLAGILEGAQGLMTIMRGLLL